MRPVAPLLPPDDYSDLPGMLTHPDLSGVVLGWIADDTASATALRGASRGCRDGVAAYAWADKRAHIRHVARWRAAFPAARAAVCCFRLCDADFVHLRGVHTLDISFCYGVTDAAFAHLAGIHTLIMERCSGITDAAFAHLAGIHTLDMSKCSQETITDAAFAHLGGIHTLKMRWCRQNTITDAAFAHLGGIHTLDMRYCKQYTITDAAFAHLAGIRELDADGCTQLTDAAFAHLAGASIHRHEYDSASEPDWDSDDTERLTDFDY